jgi:hypothetical protein
VIPHIPGDAAAAAAQSAIGLSREAVLAPDFIDAENASESAPNFPGVTNPGKGSNTTLGNNQADINYDGWDEWHEEPPAGY